MATENSRIRRSLGPGLRDLKNARRDRAAVQERLFAPDEFTTFIRSLPALVEQTGGTDPGAAHDAGPEAAFTSRHAGLTVRGTLDQITALLQRLQENRPRVWVDAFRMECGAARGDPARDGA